ncbi:hypothetical protein [Cryptosporangium sp. NPDC051539]|uniref:hypothetical protein n=1 Tax=Cryptosporangium sp. NPDC051539 TaxID=3363962 RepID=UPI0037A7653E
MATRTRNTSAGRPTAAPAGRPGSTRPAQSRPPTARTDQSRPPAAARSIATRLPVAPCARPIPVLRRPWALAAADLSAPPMLPAVRLPRIDFVIVVPRPAAGGEPVTDPDDDRRAAEIVFASAASALAVLLTLATVSTLLPGVVAVGGLALGFLGLSGAFAGYAGWRWVRWVRHRTERLHWSVIAAASATITAAELYGAAGIAVAHSGFFERLTTLFGFGFAAAVTVAVTGVASLITYHRANTDAQLSRWARRFA